MAKADFQSPFRRHFDRPSKNWASEVLAWSDHDRSKERLGLVLGAFSFVALTIGLAPFVSRVGLSIVATVVAALLVLAGNYYLNRKRHRWDSSVEELHERVGASEVESLAVDRGHSRVYSPEMAAFDRRIDDLYDQIGAMRRGESEDTGDLHTTIEELRRLQRQEARAYRKAFEASLNFPIHAADDVLAKMREARHAITDDSPTPHSAT